MSTRTNTKSLNSAGECDTDLQCLTVRIADQLFGIPVQEVRDIFTPRDITPIPLAPKEVAGAINLRGRILTAIDVRTKLNLPPLDGGTKQMNVSIELDGELYGLMVDKVGEVLNLAKEDFERNPSTLDSRWKAISAGIFKLDGELLIVMQTSKIINSDEICSE